MLTSFFPFAHGEEFLETEIEYLTKYFDQIHIFPKNFDKNRRPLPPKVQISHLFFSNKILKKFTILRKSLFSSMFWIEFFNHPFNYIKWKPLKHLIFMTGESKKNLNKFSSYIQKNGLEEALFYSYWCDHSPLILMLLKKKHPKITIISRAHGGDLYHERMPAGTKFLRQRLLSNLDYVFTISNHGRDYLLSNYTLKSSKIIVSRLGVNPSKKKTSPSSTEEFFSVVSCSFLTPVKRINLLIKALAIVAKRLPEVKFNWSHLGDGPLRNELEQHAKESFPSNVSFCFYGYIKNKKITEFYYKNSIDLFINLSVSEGLPVSMMEAQSCGLPILATNVGGVSEIVNSSNGYLLPKEITPEVIADKMISIKSNTKELNQKKISAYHHWEQHFNALKNYESFAQKISRLRSQS